ncbi:MAG: glycosyltransferase, partial [Planctomycetes bacterium]|nr:glycosyltransferase [Planctomycetota bacterium]
RVVEAADHAVADEFVLTHCGQFYGPRSPRMWFEALKLARDGSPEVAGRIHLQLLGPERYDGRPLTTMAAEAGVADQVHVLGPKSHQDTLSFMAGSDALILAGSAGKGAELQVPNKLFEYLAARKPIIAAVRNSSPVVDILAEACAEAVVCEPEDASSLANALVQLAARQQVSADSVVAGCPISLRPTLSREEGGETSSGAFGESCETGDPWSGVGRFDRRCRGAELERIFRRVSQPNAKNPGHAPLPAAAKQETG